MPPVAPNHKEYNANFVDPRLGEDKVHNLSDRARTIWHKHAIYHMRTASTFWLRQYPEKAQLQNLPPPAALPSFYPFSPYIPTDSLHAKIVPLDKTEDSSLTSGRLSSVGAALIAIGTLIIAALAIMGLYMTRSLIIKKASRILNHGYRQKQNQSQVVKEDHASETEAAIPVQEYDDLGWGTLTRYMYVESISDAHKHGYLEQKELSNSIRTLSPLPAWPTHDEHGLPKAADSEFRQEEHDIPPAQLVVIQGCRAQEEESFQPSGVEPKLVASRSLPHLGCESNVSIFGSLQASLDQLAKGVSILSVQTRPRQGSDAFEPSDGMSISREIMDCFSTTSSRSSLSSFSSFGSDSEFSYEVKHAEAKSVDIRRGVLVTCAPSSTPTCEYGTTLPTFVISKPSPLQPCLENWEHPNTIYSLENLRHSLATLNMSQTGGSLTSLVREGSRGTINSLSTSFSTTTRTEGWCSEEDEFLQTPVVPYLMVTRPSDSSVHTTGSIASSISIDLDEFPLPPIPVERSYYSELMEHIRPRMRVWDNHSAESSVAQRVTTVQQFMTMYSRST